MALPEHSAVDNQQDAPDHRYTSEPTTIPPGGIRWVRYTIHTAGGGLWSKGRREYWTDLDLRVRVGAFTRNEDVGLDDNSMTLVESR